LKLLHKDLEYFSFTDDLSQVLPLLFALLLIVYKSVIWYKLSKFKKANASLETLYLEYEKRIEQQYKTLIGKLNETQTTG
jgi:hypothetical protein